MLLELSEIDLISFKIQIFKIPFALNGLEPHQLQSAQLFVHTADLTVELLVDIFHLLRNIVTQFKTGSGCRDPWSAGTFVCYLTTKVHECTLN